MSFIKKIIAVQSAQDQPPPGGAGEGDPLIHHLSAFDQLLADLGLADLTPAEKAWIKQVFQSEQGWRRWLPTWSNLQTLIQKLFTIYPVSQQAVIAGDHWHKTADLSNWPVWPINLALPNQSQTSQRLFYFLRGLFVGVQSSVFFLSAATWLILLGRMGYAQNAGDFFRLLAGKEGPSTDIIAQFLVKMPNWSLKLLASFPVFWGAGYGVMKIRGRGPLPDTETVNDRLRHPPQDIISKAINWTLFLPHQHYDFCEGRLGWLMLLRWLPVINLLPPVPTITNHYQMAEDWTLRDGRLNSEQRHLIMDWLVQEARFGDQARQQDAMWVLSHIAYGVSFSDIRWLDQFTTALPVPTRRLKDAVVTAPFPAQDVLDFLCQLNILDPNTNKILVTAEALDAPINWESLAGGGDDGLNMAGFTAHVDGAIRTQLKTILQEQAELAQAIRAYQRDMVQFKGRALAVITELAENYSFGPGQGEHGAITRNMFVGGTARVTYDDSHQVLEALKTANWVNRTGKLLVPYDPDSAAAGAFNRAALDAALGTLSQQVKDQAHDQLARLQAAPPNWYTTHLKPSLRYVGAHYLLWSLFGYSPAISTPRFKQAAQAIASVIVYGYKGTKLYFLVTGIIALYHSLQKAINCPGELVTISNQLRISPNKADIPCFEQMLANFRSGPVAIRSDVTDFVDKIRQFDLSGLDHLSLSHKYLTTMEITQILAAVRGQGAKLVEINLAGNCIIGDEMWQLLAELSHHPVESLSLYFNPLTDFGAHQLAVFLPHTQINDLNLGLTRVGDPGLSAFIPRLPKTHLNGFVVGDHVGAQVAARFIEALPGTQLRTIGLIGDELGENTANALAVVLRQNPAFANQLKGLAFGKNLTASAIAELAELMQLPDLATLNLFGPMGNEGAMILGPLLADSSIESLGIYGSNMSDSGAQGIATGVPGSKIWTMSIEGSRIGSPGGQALADAAIASKSLLQLGLYDNHIGPTAGDRFAAAMRQSRLGLLGLGKNRLGDGGCLPIAQALDHTPLRTLAMQHDQLTDVCAFALAKHFGNLENLFVQGNVNITLAGAKALADAATPDTQTIDLGNIPAAEKLAKSLATDAIESAWREACLDEACRGVEPQNAVSAGPKPNRNPASDPGPFSNSRLFHAMESAFRAGHMQATPTPQDGNDPFYPECTIPPTGAKSATSPPIGHMPPLLGYRSLSSSMITSLAGMFGLLLLLVAFVPALFPKRPTRWQKMAAHFANKP